MYVSPVIIGRIDIKYTKFNGMEHEITEEKTLAINQCI